MWWPSWYRPPHITLDEALKTSPQLKEMYDGDDRVRNLIDTARALEGMPRNTSTHAAGVVITKLPVEHYVPLSKNDDTVVTQYPMTTIEEGLLKMDFLGLRNLTVIAEAEAEIRKTGWRSPWPTFRMTIPTSTPCWPRGPEQAGGGKSDQMRGHGLLLASIEASCLRCMSLAMAAVADSRRRNVEGQLGMFAMLDEETPGLGIAVPKMNEVSRADRMAMEKETTGLYLSGHPMDDYRPYLKNTHVLPIGSLMDEERTVEDESIVSVAGIIQKVRLKTTRNNSMMAYVTLEDDTGSMELLTFSNVLTQFGSLVQEGAAVVVIGRLSIRDEKDPQVVVNRVQSILDYADGNQGGERPRCPGAASSISALLPRACRNTGRPRPF